MTQLSKFMATISGNARRMAAITALGIVAAAAPASDAVASDHAEQAPRVVVSSRQDAWGMAERAADQVGGMKTFADALQGTLYSSLPGLQKAKNIAIAYAFQLRQASHPEYERMDDYLAAVPDDPAVDQGLRDLVQVINARKMELYEMSTLLLRIEHAYAREDGASVEALAAQLSELAGRAQLELAEDDIPFGYDDPQGDRPRY